MLCGIFHQKIVTRVYGGIPVEFSTLHTNLCDKFFLSLQRIIFLHQIVSKLKNFFFVTQLNFWIFCWRNSCVFFSLRQWKRSKINYLWSCLCYSFINHHEILLQINWESFMEFQFWLCKFSSFCWVSFYWFGGEDVIQI